jgi:hypothetical protein
MVKRSRRGDGDHGERTGEYDWPSYEPPRNPAADASVGGAISVVHT